MLLHPASHPGEGKSLSGGYQLMAGLLLQPAEPLVDEEKADQSLMSCLCRWKIK